MAGATTFSFPLAFFAATGGAFALNHDLVNAGRVEVEHAFELLSAADEQTKLSADPAGVMMTLLPQLVGEHASA